MCVIETGLSGDIGEFEGIATAAAAAITSPNKDEGGERNCD